MIPLSELAEVGNFTKPHGVKGEIAASFDEDVVCLIVPGSHIFVELDGLFVPFTVMAVRSKGAETLLVTLKGINSDGEAAQFANKSVYLEEIRIPEAGDDATDRENFYLDDLVGYTIIDGDSMIGEITDYDDSTDNVLFIVMTPDGRTIYVPASDGLITGIDSTRKEIVMNLPEGLIHL